MNTNDPRRYCNATASRSTDYHAIKDCLGSTGVLSFKNRIRDAEDQAMQDMLRHLGADRWSAGSTPGAAT